MIQINSSVTNRYTTMVDGNDGEEQLVIIESGGQDGYTVTTVVRVQIDGGMEILLTRASLISEEQDNANFITTLRGILQAWVSGGIPPTEQEKAVEFAKIEMILANFFEGGTLHHF